MSSSSQSPEEFTRNMDSQAQLTRNLLRVRLTVAGISQRLRELESANKLHNPEFLEETTRMNRELTELESLMKDPEFCEPFKEETSEGTGSYVPQSMSDWAKWVQDRCSSALSYVKGEK